MLFNNNDEPVRDRVIYNAKPNMILGCKKAIFGVILLVIILSVSPGIIRFIGEMQVYLISYVQLSLTRYAAIALFVIILIDVIYIIWQLIGWYSLEYTLTESKVIIKSGVLSTKKNYMPYAAIQDINTSQGIFAKIFNVGTVSLFSAYDNNQMELKNISNPSEIEEIIFSRMVGQRNYQAMPPRYPPQQQNNYEKEYEDDYLGRNDYYDEYEPITPITHERNSYSRGDYEYYPEDFNDQKPQRHTYKYEAYDNSQSGRSQGSYYNQEYDNSQSRNSQGSYYNQVKDNYSHSNDDYYQENDSEINYNEPAEEFNEPAEDDVAGDSSQAIKRHFDKFKK